MHRLPAKTAGTEEKEENEAVHPGGPAKLTIINDLCKMIFQQCNNWD